jgi:hypothetical protein
LQLGHALFLTSRMPLPQFIFLAHSDFIEATNSADEVRRSEIRETQSWPF